MKPETTPTPIHDSKVLSVMELAGSVMNYKTKIGRPTKPPRIVVSYSLPVALVRQVNEMASAANQDRSATVEDLLRIAVLEAGKGWPDNVVRDGGGQ